MESIIKLQAASFPFPYHSEGIKSGPLPQLTEIDIESAPISTSSTATISPASLTSEKQHFTTDIDLIYIKDVDFPLPEKKYARIIRNLRHTFFTVYRRLFTIVFLLNMVGVGILFWKHGKKLDDVGLLADLANIASANVMVALLVRVDYVVNAFFK